MIKVSSDLAFSGCDEQVVPEIELSSFIKIGLLQVGLEDVGPGTSVLVHFLFFYLLLYLGEVGAVLDVSTSIAKLTRFDYPTISPLFALFIELSQKFQVLLILETAGNMECLRNEPFFII